MPVRYDEYVKEPGVITEFTPEMIDEIEKCKNDFNEFMKYIKIVHVDRGRIPFEPYEYQKELLELIKNNRFIVSLQSRQSGKCISSLTSIKVKNKKTNSIEEITISDFFDRIKSE